MAFVRSGLFVLTAAILSACGGGGSTSTPAPVTPPPSSNNNAPVFSSSSAVSVAENTVTSFYTVTATDADNDTLDITMSGGADMNQFEFGTADGLSFENPPNFENPTDQNGDNIYQVEFTVDDGKGGSAVMTVDVTITDEAQEMIRKKDLVFGRALVEQNVLYRTVGTGTSATDLYMDIFTPEGDTNTDRPVMIVAFGGGFIEGDRDQVAGIAANFALRGYVAASIDYRLFQNGTPNDIELLTASINATQDMYAAVRFFRDEGTGSNQYGIDPNKIFVGGISAGAIMAVAVGVLDEDDQAVSGLLAPFLGSGGLYGEGATARDSAAQGVLSISGAALDLNAIDTESAILYAAHEELDPVVPCGTGGEGSSSTGLVISGGCAMVPAYDALAVPAELYLLESVAAHVGFTQAQYGEILQGSADLFYANVISRD